jgi:hypothetical protein
MNQQPELAVITLLQGTREESGSWFELSDDFVLQSRTDGRLKIAVNPSASVTMTDLTLTGDLDVAGLAAVGDLLVNGETVSDIVLENTYFENMQFGHSPASGTLLTATGAGPVPAYFDFSGVPDQFLKLAGTGTSLQWQTLVTANVTDLLSGSHTWALSQIFTASASFQSATVPFVVVGTDRVDNLDAHYLGAVGQDAAFFRNAGNLNAGTLLDARLSSNVAQYNAAAPVFTGGDFTVQRTGANGQVFVSRAAGAGIGIQAQATLGQVYSVGSFPLSLGSNSTQRWQITSSGHWLAVADATYDIGASGATRPRDLYLSRDALLPGIGRVGSQTSGTGLVVGSQTATMSSLGSNVGLDVYADFNNTAGAVNFINPNVGTSAGLQLTFGLADSAGAQKRAGNIRVVKNGTWASATASTQNADMVFRQYISGADTQAMALRNGILSMGTTVFTTGATAGDITVANLRGMRGVNAAGSTTLPLTFIDASDRTNLGLNTLALGLSAPLLQTTVGAAGAASALPATPSKYWVVRDVTGGADYVIPLYAKV